MTKLAILSGGNPPKYKSHINHGVYALKHGLTYRRDITRYANLQNANFHKLRAIDAALGDSDWLLWMDDDAFFMDFEKDMRDFIRDVPDDVFFVASKSPVNPQGGWTFLNSGVMFLRNCETSRHLIRESDAVPKPLVESWWREDKVGMLTSGEQLHMIYVLHRDGLLPRTRLHSYEAFNARPYHYKDDPIEFPVCHFPGVPDRDAAISQFGARFGRDDTLVPPDLLSEFGMTATQNAAKDHWRKPSSYNAGWNERARLAATLQGPSICDIGCGAAQSLRQFIQGDYHPADIVAWTPDVEICDLNLGKFPERSLARSDTCYLLGVLEYMHDLPKLFSDIRSRVNRLVLSYNPTDTVPERYPTWVNHLTSYELANLLGLQGLVIEKQIRHGGEMIFSASGGFHMTRPNRRLE